MVVPSLPGYGFSGKPSATGWDIHRIARAWAELMARLGYGRFLAMGSDWGTSVSTSLALQHPGRLLGIHLVPPLAPPGRAASDLTDDERAALADLDQRGRTGSGYSAVQGTRPQTIGYSLTDSPAGLEQSGALRRRPPGPGRVDHRRVGALAGPLATLVITGHTLREARQVFAPGYWRRDRLPRGMSGTTSQLRRLSRRTPASGARTGRRRS